MRELENVIGNACMMVEGNVVDLADLPVLIKASPERLSDEDTDLISFEELQHRHLLRVLERVGGNKARAAEVLGVSRTTVYEILSKIQTNRPSAKAKEAASGATS